MPPLNIPAGDYAVRPYSSITSGLMNTILVSKSKVREWAEHEKAKADSVAESYRQKVEEQQAAVDNQATTLLAVQLERGMQFDNKEGVDEDTDQAESIAARKTSLEEQKHELETEIAKLDDECKSREHRVHGKTRKTRCPYLRAVVSLPLFWNAIHSLSANPTLTDSATLKQALRLMPLHAILALIPLIIHHALQTKF